MAYAVELSHPDSALAIYEQTILLSKAANDSLRLGKSTSYKGTQLSNMGRYDSAKHYLKESIQICRNINYERGLAVALNNLANIEQFTGIYPDAMQYYMEALPYFEQLGDTGALIMITTNLASVFNSLHLHEKSRDYFQKNIALSLAIGDSARIGDSYSSLGSSLLALKDTLAAQDAFLTALRYDIGEHFLKVIVHLGLSDVYYGSDPKKSLFHAIQANAYALKKSDAFRITHTYVVLAERYMRTRAFKEAEAALAKGIALAKKGDLQDELAYAYYIQYQLDGLLGNYEAAYQTFGAYLAIRDSIYSKENTEVVATLEAKYQLEKKTLEIENQRLILKERVRDIERQRLWIGVILLVLLLVVVVWVSTLRNYRIRKKALLQDQAIKAQNAMLAGEEKERGRIARELHDGVAGSIAATGMQLANMAGSDKDELHTIIAQLNKTSQEIREISHNLMPEILKKVGLKEAIEGYFGRIKQATDINIHFEALHINRRFDSFVELTLYRIVQELITNIVKHAHATEVMVQLALHGHTLSLTVEDDGRGMETPKFADDSGFETIRARILPLAGTLDIDSAPTKGTSVYIEMKLNP